MSSDQTSESSEETKLYDRAMGCLMGQAIGDALGTRYEFEKSVKVKKQIAKDMGKTKFLPMLGGGPFGLVPGQVTDDTELALALARCLVKESSFDIYEIAQAYVTWFHSQPFDVGKTTSQAFQGTDPKLTGERNYE